MTAYRESYPSCNIIRRGALLSPIIAILVLRLVAIPQVENDHQKSMLRNCNLVGLLSTAKPDEARQFYEKELGFTFVKDDGFAMVLKNAQITLRLNKQKTVEVAKRPVIGWSAPSIETTVAALAAKGVVFDKSNRGALNELGVFTSDQGEQIAWFLDPDGNILSIRQPRQRSEVKESERKSPLTDLEPIVFVAISKVHEAQRFYGEVLGLEITSQDDRSLVFKGANGMLHLDVSQDFTPPSASVLVWEVPNIEQAITSLTERGVEIEMFDALPQDSNGVMTFPNGDKVAWFKDPDDNMLSIAQFSADESENQR